MRKIFESSLKDRGDHKCYSIRQKIESQREQREKDTLEVKKLDYILTDD